MVHALLALIYETGDLPGVEAVAERAHVSKRTVFRLFQDVAALHGAVVEIQREEVLRRFPPPMPEGTSLTDRIRLVVQHRADMYEHVMPIRRVAERLRYTVPAISETLASDRLSFRSHVELMFFEDVRVFGREAGDRLHGIELATSWTAWRALRHDQGCSVDRAKRITSNVVRHFTAPATDDHQPGGDAEK